MRASTPLPASGAAAAAVAAPRPWMAAAALIALTLTAYANCFSDVFVGFNALRSIRDNPDIQQLRPLWRALSLHLTGGAAIADGGTLVRRPVLSLSFALNTALFGSSPSSYQAVNLAIHIAAGLVLFGIMRRTMRFLGGSAGIGLPLAVAALWLVHPLQTESVTYIPQRAESLMGLFLLLTLYCSVRAWGTEARRRVWEVSAVTFCALGMATKEVMVVAPLLVWLYDAVLIQRSFQRPLDQRRGFYVALGATWLILAVLLAVTWPDVRIDFHPPRILPYALSQPTVILHYLQLVFWPTPLHLYVNSSELWFDTAAPHWGSFLIASVTLGVLVLATVRALRRLRWSGYAGAWFFLLLAPTSTFVATSDVLQEHRMYLALAAPIALAVAAGAAVGRTASVSPPFVTFLKGVVVALLLAPCVLLTRARNLDYHSEFGAYAPQDLASAYGVIAHYELVLRRDAGAARRLFERMLELDLPQAWTNYGQPRFHRARVLNALGAVGAMEGSFDAARRLFDAALQAQPGWAVADHNRGVVELVAGSPAVAADHLARAIDLDPEIAASPYAFGLALMAGGETQRAAPYLSRDSPRSARDWQELLGSAPARRRNLLLRLSFPGTMRPFDYVLYPRLAETDAG